MYRTNALRVPLLMVVLAFLLLPSFALASNKKGAELRQIQRLRHTTWHWQTVMGVRRTPASHNAKRLLNPAYRHWVLKLWRHRSRYVLRRAVHVPHKTQWLCIHRGEGAWNAHSGNGYYGGLQMDLEFQRTYGAFLLRSKGTADRWNPYEQMWVAERAYESGRGFYPWPNAARACGLI